MPISTSKTRADKYCGLQIIIGEFNDGHLASSTLSMMDISFFARVLQFEMRRLKVMLVTTAIIQYAREEEEVWQYRDG